MTFFRSGNRRFEIELDDREHSVKGRTQADVFYRRLQVRDAIDQRRSIAESRCIALLLIAAAGKSVGRIIDGEGAGN